MGHAARWRRDRWRACILLLPWFFAGPGAAQSLTPNVYDPYGIGSQVNGNAQDRTGSSNRPNADQTSAAAAAGQVQAPPTQTPLTRDIIDDQDSSAFPADDRRSGSRRMTSQRFSDDDLAAPRTVVRRPYRPSEFETYVSKIADQPLRRFGAELLVPEARNFITPTATAVPPSYLLKPGDQLNVGLAGSVNASNLRLTIDAEGRIFVPQVGAVSLAGVRYGDAQDVISRAVSRQYRNFNVSVTVGRLHGITVYVTGFAAIPGSYTVTSLSTLVDAVLAAGGPAAGGSFRSIQLRRSGKLVSDFDLYDLLLKGDSSTDALLENGDVIYIAPVGAQVAVIGSVNHEAIYEAKGRDSLRDVLLYAGGINTVGDDSRLLFLDTVKAAAAGWQEVSPAQLATMAAGRGGILRALSNLDIAQPTAKLPVLVTLSGEVERPGRYYVQPGASFSQVVAQAGGMTREAFAYGIIFTRERVRREQRTSNERALNDVESTLTAQPLVSLAAREIPDRLTTVANLMKQLRSAAPDGRLILDTPPNSATIPGEIVLENNDSIYIPPRPTSVGVFGAVPSPSSFVFRPGERIGDVLKHAGGVNRFADRNQMFVVRANGSVLARNRGGSIGRVLNQRALPGDLVYVPINALRGEFWANLRDATSGLMAPLTAVATVAAVTH